MNIKILTLKLTNFLKYHYLLNTCLLMILIAYNESKLKLIKHCVGTKLYWTVHLNFEVVFATSF